MYNNAHIRIGKQKQLNDIQDKVQKYKAEKNETKQNNNEKSIPEKDFIFLLFSVSERP